MRISDWSSDVCSSDLLNTFGQAGFMAGNPPTLPMTQGYDAPYRFLVNRMAFVALGLGVFFSSFNTWRVSEQNITLSDVMFMIAAMMLIAHGRINLSPFRELTVLWLRGLDRTSVVEGKSVSV